MFYKCQIFHGFALLTANLWNRTFNALYIWALHYGNEVCRIYCMCPWRRASMSQNTSSGEWMIFYLCALFIIYSLLLGLSSVDFYCKRSYSKKSVMFIPFLFNDVQNKISLRIRQVYSFTSLKLIPEHNKRSCYQ